MNNTPASTSVTAPGGPSTTAAVSSSATGAALRASLTAEPAAPLSQLESDAMARQFMGEEAAPGPTGTKPPKAKTAKTTDSPDPDPAEADAGLSEHADDPENLDTPDNLDPAEPGDLEDEAADPAAELEADPDADPDADETDTATAAKSPLDHLLKALIKDPENPALQKRMRKILAEAPELKRLNAELTAKLEQSSGPPVITVAPTELSPLAHVVDAAGLKDAVATAERWEAWLDDHPEGGQPYPDKEDSYLSAEEVKANLRHIRKMLRAAPEQEKWIAQAAATRTKLKPLLAADATLLPAATQVLQEGRINATNADHFQDAVDLVRGRRARQDEEKGIKKITLQQVVPKTAAAPGSHAAAPRRTSAQPGTSSGAPATRPSSAGVDVAALKKQAEAGDQKAADKLATLWLQTA